jgi:myo-inositol-1(or 4)-monophosphatase
MIYDDFLAIAMEGARRGAEILKENFGKIRMQQAQSKGISDYVSRVDRESEETLHQFLTKALPEASFLGEEQGQQGRTCDYRWIVDPLDGTTNYLQGFPVFGVSVALERVLTGREWGEIIVGVVMHPITGETWSAVRGMGARKDGRPIQIGVKEELSHALLATGFPFRAKDRLDEYLKTFRELFLRCSGIRRAGAASLDLCWTAEGIFDGFWEHALSPWDIAAGALIIEEAGGRITGFEGKEDFLQSGDVVAANALLHPQMLEIIRANFRSTLSQ